MNPQNKIPSFDTQFPELNRFILDLVDAYNAGEIGSWDDLEEKVNIFFTPERMNKTESIVPGWKKMASYSDGVTLTHVMCVFLGLFMLPEFQALTLGQQQLAKWIVLFHDVDKIHIRGKKDTMHAFRSGAVAAKILPKFGFPISAKYDVIIHSWSEFTFNAFTIENENPAPKPDNRKLPDILSGIEQLFGEDTPATLIVKTALLHISLGVDKNYPTPSPLTEAEIRELINPTLFPLLKVMMLADNEGWTLFESETRNQQNRDMLEAFVQIEELIV